MVSPASTSSSGPVPWRASRGTRSLADPGARQRALVAGVPRRAPPDADRDGAAADPAAVRVVAGRPRRGVTVDRGQGGLPVADHALGVGAVEREAGEELGGHAAAAAGVVRAAGSAGAGGLRFAQRAEQLGAAPDTGEAAVRA